jgi:hypothetical protein
MGIMHISVMTEDDVRRAMIEACRAAGSAVAWATKHGISPAYVADVRHNRRAPGHKILAALGIKRTTVYRAARDAVDNKE